MHVGEIVSVIGLRWFKPSVISFGCDDKDSIDKRDMSGADLSAIRSGICGNLIAEETESETVFWVFESLKAVGLGANGLAIDTFRDFISCCSKDAEAVVRGCFILSLSLNAAVKSYQWKISPEIEFNLPEKDKGLYPTV